MKIVNTKHNENRTYKANLGGTHMDMLQQVSPSRASCVKSQLITVRDNTILLL